MATSVVMALTLSPWSSLCSNKNKPSPHSFITSRTTTYCSHSRCSKLGLGAKDASYRVYSVRFVFSPFVKCSEKLKSRRKEEFRSEASDGRPLSRELRCEVQGDEVEDVKKRGDRFRSWLLNRARKQQQPVGERVMRMVAGASAAPIAQYISSPVTPLHTLDPRVKQAWLLALVVLPARSHMAIRIGMVAFLAMATVWTLPRRIWQDQLGRMAILSVFLFVMLALGTDGVPTVVQTRRPLPLAEGLPKLPAALGGYKYLILKLGPVQLTRKGVAVAAAASCLSFTVLQSASLCLTTTTPEQLAAALRWYMGPLVHVGAPVEELILTLLLSLRFIGLVFDEVRNIAVGVVARGIDWKLLKLTETADTFFNLFGRIFKNLFSHAEQISQAMVARGYRGNAAKHRIYFLTKLCIKPWDWVAIGGLLVLVALSMYSDIMLPA